MKGIPNEIGRRDAWLVLLCTLLVPCPLGATEITGTVTAVSGDSAIIAIDGDAWPNAGDKVEIFFKLGDAEVSVGSGKVTETSAASVTAKVEKATGTVSKDQFARIDSGNAKKRPAVATTTSAAPLPAVFLGVMMSLTDDSASPSGVQVVQVIPDSPALVAGFLVGDFIVAVDGSPVTKPQEVSDALASSSPGATHAFLVSRSGKLHKLEAKLAARPPDFPPSSQVESTPDASKPPDEQQISIGDERYNRRDFDGAINAYDEAIRLNPGNSWGYRNRGAALVQKDQFEKAIADYEEAIKLDPKTWKQSLGGSIKDLRALLDTKKQ